MTQASTLLLIDGHALAYRMHFALETTGMHVKQGDLAGTPTWVVYGFFMALFTVLKSHQPQAVVVAFDVSRESFRTELYAEYKAHRQSMPDDLKAQMALLIEGIEALGIPIFQVAGVEADDVIGTLSLQASQMPGWQVDILTGDQDAFQLVDEAGRVKVLIPSRKPKEGLTTYGWQQVIEKLGVTPAQVIDFKGLKGDTSDNIPGVPGIGDKTGAKLLADYHTLEGVYQHLEAISGKKLVENLTTYKEQAFLSQQLATINRFVQGVQFDPEASRLFCPNPEQFEAFLARCDFRAFLGQWPQLAPLFGVQGSAPPLSLQALELKPRALAPVNSGLPVSAGLASQPAQVLPAFKPQCVTNLAQLQAFLAKATANGVLALDLETTGLDVLTVSPVGIALATGDGLAQSQWQPKQPFSDEPESLSISVLKAEGELTALEAIYIPVGHQVDLLTNHAQPQLSWQQVKPLLQKLLENEQVVKIVHNLKYETNCLKSWGLGLNGLIVDTMIASYVLDSDRRHGLKALALSVFGIEMTEIQSLIGKGKAQKTFDTVSIEEATTYGAHDAYVTWLLAVEFLKELATPQNERLWQLFYTLELPLAHVLAAMERTGITLDVAQLAALNAQLKTQLTQLEADIYQLAGGPFNLNSPKQVADVLFVKLGLAPQRKTASKEAYSTDAKVLESLAGDYPVVAKLLEYRQLFKLQSTYIEALPALVHPQTGRLHTHFNQVVTATGRLSSSEPNLQNIPVRTEWGGLIRQAFVPQKNSAGKPWALLSADYSQIELRLLAHLCQDPRLVAAFNSGEDIHTATAALVFGLTPQQVTKEQRYKAKAVNFGIVYGQTAHGLSQQLKIPRAEAQAFIDRYFATYPGVLAFMEEVKAEAHQSGEVWTMLGRRRQLAEGLNNRNKNLREFAERAAFNTPIQGSAADLMKLAMVRLQQALELKQAQGFESRLLLQVHDELVLEAPEHEKAELEAMVRAAMELGQPLSVPLVVDCYWGPSWLEV